MTSRSDRHLVLLEAISLAALTILGVHLFGPSSYATLAGAAAVHGYELRKESRNA